jgi:ectoine hydroxylase-related dioxygenase (phytanoyl-CoA dioxygenase family)
MMHMSFRALDRLQAYCEEIDEAGFALIPDTIGDDEIATVVKALAQLSAGQSSRRGRVYAARNLLATVPAIGELASRPAICALVEPILGRNAFPVRGILFDKVPGANWHVGWHQDRIIPVAERREVPGFTAWSTKHGVPHVRPPISILARMLTLRIHLDDCSAENGALRVIPQSHSHGLLNDDEVQQFLSHAKPFVCEAQRGTVLVMRPLLLHASSPATTPTHRRVIHLEFAADPLPGGLTWAR